MNIESLLRAMTPEVYERLRNAVETGKWFDGSPLSDEQRESSMQAVMLYQARVLKSNEHMTVSEKGDITHKSRQDFKQELASQQSFEADPSTPSIARFKQDDF